MTYFRLKNWFRWNFVQNFIHFLLLLFCNFPYMPSWHPFYWRWGRLYNDFIFQSPRTIIILFFVSCPIDKRYSVHPGWNNEAISPITASIRKVILSSKLFWCFFKKQSIFFCQILTLSFLLYFNDSLLLIVLGRSLHLYIHQHVFSQKFELIIL